MMNTKLNPNYKLLTALVSGVKINHSVICWMKPYKIEHQFITIPKTNLYFHNKLLIIIS